MLLGGSNQGEWLREMGCEVAGSRRRFKFLGVWSGRHIQQQEIIEQIIITIEKCLQSWVNKSLSFVSRILLIKHVFSAIPSHHLMSLGLDTKGLARIRRSLRTFLWGMKVLPPRQLPRCLFPGVSWSWRTPGKLPDLSNTNSAFLLRLLKENRRAGSNPVLEITTAEAATAGISTRSILGSSIPNIHSNGTD
ncbi:hypothetical protein R1sor_009771 [Riccia sorocarpa]|uniref:Uncharacterized protein n=1 Tax=Riccia sorocarpa TaxID=122646 RepID=A0ABD3HZM4_9MARC